MTIYIVVETSWDHHENIGVFDSYDKAADIQGSLEENKQGYHYDIEEFQLNAAPM
jgi:hypothetical protein